MIKLLFAVWVGTLAMSALPGGTAQAAQTGDVAAVAREFWRDSVTRLAAWPPELQYDPAGGLVRFTGYRGAPCTGRLLFPAHPAPYAGAVLHIGDAGFAPSPLADRDDLVHLYVGWDPAAPDSRWQPPTGPDPTRYCLYAAALNLCRAYQLLRSAPGVTPGTVGILGEGLGAWGALAVAGAYGREVRFVVAHQPWPLRHLPADFTSPAGRALASLASRFDAAALARTVAAPILLTAGEQDRLSPPAQVALVAAACPPESDLLTLPGAAHLPGALWPSWTSVCRRWMYARPVAAALPPAPGPAVAEGVPSAEAPDGSLPLAGEPSRG